MQFSEYGSNGTFAELLSIAMDDKGVTSGRKLETLLKESGINNVSFKSIYRYLNGTLIPPYQKAKSILSILEIDLDEDKLLSILDASRIFANEKKQEDYSKTIVSKTVWLNYDKLLDGQTGEFAEAQLNSRIDDLFKSKRKFSEYVNSLIAKDLRENILLEVEK